MDRFRNCARQAREQSKGLWGEGLAAPVPAAPRSAHTPAGLIRGNRRSMIYHLPGCPNYNDLSPASVVSFGSEQEAVDAGYRKAKNCP